MACWTSDAFMQPVHTTTGVALPLPPTLVLFLFPSLHFLPPLPSFPFLTSSSLLPSFPLLCSPPSLSLLPSFPLFCSPPFLSLLPSSPPLFSSFPFLSPLPFSVHASIHQVSGEAGKGEGGGVSANCSAVSTKGVHR